ncbi:MAG: adenosylcobinamide-phosphate synthase CbiB [Polaromonas sp.]|nr:adenosylcobinamide-phosphate synthase CbiB [Polaromonas sp.]
MNNGVPLVFAAAVLVAFAIDRYCGEPPVRWHPVVWMGNYLNGMAAYVAPVEALAAFNSRDSKAFSLGALAWLAGAALVLMAACALQWAFFQLPGVLAALLMGLALKPMLAWAMLRREAQAVEDALCESLAAGRERLSWLVSRDTSQLSAGEVRESAIESLAENLNDSVVAPIFWFMLLGLPGAAVYRFANTADAMWGYRGVRRGVNWAWAGKWAAWADDALSWLPARLTALLLAVAAGGLHLKALRLEARKTPSPNSGWPMAAMALALGVSLRKPGVYTLNPAGRPPEAPDTLKAQQYASKVVKSLVWIASMALFLTALALSAGLRS